MHIESKAAAIWKMAPDSNAQVYRLSEIAILDIKPTC